MGYKRRYTDQDEENVINFIKKGVPDQIVAEHLGLNRNFVTKVGLDYWKKKMKDAEEENT